MSSATSGYIYLPKRRVLKVWANDDEQWGWRYSNGNGNTISEGTVSPNEWLVASPVIGALQLAAKAAGIAR